MAFLEQKLSAMRKEYKNLDDEAFELCEMDDPFSSTATAREAIRLESKIKRLERVQKWTRRLTLGLVK